MQLLLELCFLLFLTDSEVESNQQLPVILLDRYVLTRNYMPLALDVNLRQKSRAYYVMEFTHF